MSVLLTGAPHFKSVMTQHRHANYTLSKVLNEFVDNVIKKASQIHIHTEIDDSGSLQELRVSDNYLIGFENLDCEGAENPFNMGHVRSAHSDDSETSEFGVGMKAGALSAANQLNVYTRIADPSGGDNHKYIEVVCDFIRMSKEADVNASYNPRIKYISREEYKEIHPFDQGSTLKLSKIRDCIYPRTTLEKITADVLTDMSSTYTRFISRGSLITVNDQRVEPIYDFFDDPKCSPFTIVKEMFILEKSGGLRQYFIRKHKERIVWQEYNHTSNSWTELKTSCSDGLAHIRNLLANGYQSVYGQGFTEDGVVLQMNTTFVFCSDKFHSERELDCPEDAALIYKDDRNYGKQSLFKHNNGIHNYTLHEIEFESKLLGKDVGITFNKEISMNGKNELIMAIKAALTESKKEFSSDTGTQKYLSLFEYAVKRKLIDPGTCPIGKLPQGMRPPKPEDSSSEGGKRGRTKVAAKPKPSKKSEEPITKEPKSNDLNAEPAKNSVTTPSVASEPESKSNKTVLHQWFPTTFAVANETTSIESDSAIKLLTADETNDLLQAEPKNAYIKKEIPINENKTMRIIDLLTNTILENQLLPDEILSHIESLIRPNHCENAESANH